MRRASPYCVRAFPVPPPPLLSMVACALHCTVHVIHSVIEIRVENIVHKNKVMDSTVGLCAVKTGRLWLWYGQK